VDEQESKRISKFLSMVLRHRPETIGITLDENGWTDVSFLLRQMNRNGFPISPGKLLQVVETNNKKRFAFSERKTRIRASQGHSVAVTLGYTPQQPPSLLYHGTSERNLLSILRSGLDKRKRHHVHLSADVATALLVGQRHGKAVVLQIDTAAMHAQGYLFYLSANQVWLTDHVPAHFLSHLETSR
jgi:putative RNA 2'-phosphotransferase